MNPPGARSPMNRAAAHRGSLASIPGERYASHVGLQEPVLVGIRKFKDLRCGFMERNNKRRILKIVLVRRDGHIFIKTAYEPNDDELNLFRQLGGIFD